MSTDNSKKNKTPVHKNVIVFRCTNNMCCEEWNAFSKLDDVCGICNSIGVIIANKNIVITEKKKKYA